MAIVHNPHDKIFKKVATDRENAVSLLQNILPESIQKHLSLREIGYEKDTFIPNHLQEYFSELLLSVPVIEREQEAKVYFLFEHKSTRDPKTPIQLLRYILEIWDRYTTMAESTGERLPIVIPVLITHAKGGWEEKRIKELVDLPSEDFRAYVPDFDYILFDAIREDPETYRFTEAVEALLTIWRHSDSPEFIQTLERVFRLLQQIHPEAKFRDFVVSVMEYLSSTRSEEEYIDIYKVAEKEFSGGEEFMGTIAEMFKREGYEEAIQEKDKWMADAEIKATQKHILENLTERFDVVGSGLTDKIKSIQSLEILNALFRKTNRVNSIEEFRDLVDKAIES